LRIDNDYCGVILVDVHGYLCSGTNATGFKKVLNTR
jgi:hypothetical protein